MTSAVRERQVEFADLVRGQQAGLWRYLRFLGCDGTEAGRLPFHARLIEPHALGLSVREDET